MMGKHATDVAITAAPIPYGYVHDPVQLRAFGDPRAFERHFQTELEGRRDIRPDYIERLNHVLQHINTECHRRAAATATDSVEDITTDVLDISFKVTDRTLTLHMVGIRPCFMGHKLFQILMLQLLRSASATGKRLVIGSCFPKTLAILQRFFGPRIMTVERPYDWQAHPDCIFTNQRAMARVTPEHLGIAEDMILCIRAQEIIELRPEAFPTAVQLNDKRYVDAYYASKNPHV